MKGIIIRLIDAVLQRKKSAKKEEMMENREAIYKLEIMRNTCQKLIDEKVNLGKLVGTDVTETWKMETSFDDACQNLIEAVTLAISALEKLEAIKSCTPPSDNWEHYADRLHDIAYKYGYEEGKKDADQDRWIPVSEKLPEDEYVLISKKPTKLSGSKWCVTIAIRIADPRSGKIQWRDIGFGVIQDDKVLAWKPLPEPYQEGE